MKIPLIYYQVVNLTNAILSLFLAIFVSYVKRNSRQAALFSIFAFLVFLWDFFYFIAFQYTDYFLARFFFRTCMIAGTLILPVFTEFVFEFVGKKINKTFRFVNFSVSAIVIATIYTNYYAFDGGNFLGFYYWPIIGPFAMVAIIQYVVNVIYSQNELFKALKDGPPLMRQQVKLIIIGTFIGYIGAFTNFLLWFRIPFPPILNILIIIYVISIAYAILRYKLMDITVIIRKGIIYSVLIASIASVFAVIVFVIQNYLSSYIPRARLFSTIIAAIIITIGFKSLEDFITKATDSIFFKRKYNYQKVLKDTSSAMAHLSDLDRLVELIVRIVARNMRLTSASALVLDEKYNRYIVKAAVKKSKDLVGVSISDNYAVIEEMINSQKLIIRDEIEHELNSQNLDDKTKRHYQSMVSEMKKLQSAVCIPTFSKGKHVGKKLIGFLNLGEKLSQDMYTHEDIQLLTTLSNQAAIALENAMLYDEQIKNRERLVRSEKMAALGTMAAGIVHELKNPLAFIQTVAQLLPLKWDDQEFRETTAKMLPSEAQRMKAIIDGLLDYSRQHELKIQPVDMPQLFEKIITVMAYDFRKNNVDVKRSYTQPPRVMADANRLMQVFMNLFSNAVQAMPKGGVLELKVEDKGDRVFIQVSDSGFGIPEKQLREIFNPFFSTKEKGTGLGLSISQKIVEEHKGQMDVASEVGKGTTFTIYLPKAL